MAIAITALGTNQNKSSADPWTPFTSVALTAGDTLFLVLAADPTFDSPTTTATWNSNTMAQDGFATNTGNVVVLVYSYYSAAGGTGDIVVDWSPNNPTAMAATLYKASGLDSSSLDKSAVATGSGTTASSGVTDTLTQADELAIGAIGMEEQTDEKGTWTTGAGYVSGNDQDAGTTGGGGASNISIFGVAEIVAATTAQEAEQTSTGGNDWAAAVATYKAVAVAGWTHKYLGVANASIGKICGVAKADILKVNGVA